MPAAVGGMVLIRDEAYWSRREKIKANSATPAEEAHAIEALHVQMREEEITRMIRQKEGVE